VSNPFDQAVVDAVRKHMNTDHADDTLVMVRGVGGRPDATAARMTGLDGEGGEYAVVVDGAEETIRIPWSRPISERPEIRAEVVRLFEESRELLRHAER
jgi:putative heme iron utilization protein